ncbi:uncharacterized protein LOC128270922 [Anopheles cruzii]|uniref:uncharacterized protein LOC128270922 n=1 Tax=Anopheles cruzii TaxID=68878 RepID=UPI0022EC829D|nr:uncharacterized protein LOC128270922 [Anopheles cruzii]
MAKICLLLLVVLDGYRCTATGEWKVKRESDSGTDDRRSAADDTLDEVIYDQRQVSGGTNIRLNIKNFQVQLPESQLGHFHQSDMAHLIRDSVLRLLGISTRIAPIQPEQEQEPEASLAEKASMLQVNGNNVPAKFFLEISDFLMNTKDNDAVDDKRVDDNHNRQQEQLQGLRQSNEQHHPLYAVEEIKIERLENSNNVKNETITISTKRTNVASVPPDSPVLERNLTETRTAANASQQATESENRFVQTKPIRLDTVVMGIGAQGPPKTLREKVIWRVPSESGAVP